MSTVVPFTTRVNAALFDAPPAPGAQPRADVISALAGLLRMAESGKLQGIAVALLLDDGSALTGHAPEALGSADAVRLLGVSHMLGSHLSAQVATQGVAALAAIGGKP